MKKRRLLFSFRKAKTKQGDIKFITKCDPNIKNYLLLGLFFDFILNNVGGK